MKRRRSQRMKSAYHPLEMIRFSAAILVQVQTRGNASCTPSWMLVPRLSPKMGILYDMGCSFEPARTQRTQLRLQKQILLACFFSHSSVVVIVKNLKSGGPQNLPVCSPPLHPLHLVDDLKIELEHRAKYSWRYWRS